MQVSGTELEVCKDIEARQRLGINKYGRTVREQDYKLVEWLEHAYQEALDQAIYLKRAIEEIKATDLSSTEAVNKQPSSADEMLLAELVSYVEMKSQEMVDYPQKKIPVRDVFLLMMSILNRLVIIGYKK